MLSPSFDVAYVHVDEPGIPTGGGRLDHLPAWLVAACRARGWHFITCDYRLLPSATLSSIQDDSLAAYDFACSTRVLRLLRARGCAEVDTSKIIIMGASAGVHAASALVLRLLSVGRAPVAFFGLYGQTNLGSVFYNSPKPESTSFGPSTRQDWDSLQYLFKSARRPATQGPIKWFGVSRNSVPEGKKEEYDQTTLTLNLFYNGRTADAFTGTDGLSSRIAAADLSPDDLAGQCALIPSHLHHAFPLVGITQHGFVPTVLIHGLGDSIIPWTDSAVFAEALRAAGVPVHLHVVQSADAGHGFDREEAGRWMRDHLQPAFAQLVQMMGGCARSKL
ncbi:hypothetical protein JCM10207_003280 [Rhodosporidiobolus poonsookiae]